MLKVIDCERLQDDRFRLLVETEDASLLALLSVFESLVEFTGMFRYRSACALRIKDRKPERDILYQEAQDERKIILQKYESMEGTKKEKYHVILDYLKGMGKDWALIDDVIVMLKIARVERKKSIKEDLAREEKKSA